MPANPDINSPDIQSNTVEVRITIPENPTDADMVQILTGLYAAIQAIENPPRTPPAEAESQTAAKPRWLTFIIRAGKIFVLGTKGLSCTFRFKTTLEALQYIFQILRQAGHLYAGIIAKTAGTLFFTADGSMSVGTSEKSVAMLPVLWSEFNRILGSLRESNNGKLPLIQLFLLAALFPGCMWGTFNKGRVGVYAFADMIIRLVTDNPSPALITTCQTIGDIVGVGSAANFLVFNGLTALNILCIKQSLRDNPFWLAYNKAKKTSIFFTNFITFVISVAMTLIMAMATFYARGSSELNWSSTTEALFISISSLILNTVFTVGPNFVLKNMKEQYAALGQKSSFNHTACYDAGVGSIKSFGVISSTGNSLAVLPAIIFILFAISKESNLTQESFWNIAIAIIAWALLAVPMFPRDYAYYTKPLLEWYEKKFSPKNDTLRAEPEPPLPVGSIASFFSRFCSKNTNPVTQPLINGRAINYV